MMLKDRGVVLNTLKASIVYQIQLITLFTLALKDTTVHQEPILPQAISDPRYVHIILFTYSRHLATTNSSSAF